MRVRFTRKVVLGDGLLGTPVETRYELGQIVNLPQPVASRYIVNGSAVAVQDVGAVMPPEIDRIATAPGSRVKRPILRRPRART